MDKHFIQYRHHGRLVWVREDLQDKHTEHCLCDSCDHFKPGTIYNCVTAQMVYDLCVAAHIVTPVWECPAFRSEVEP